MFNHELLVFSTHLLLIFLQQPCPYEAFIFSFSILRLFNQTKSNYNYGKIKEETTKHTGIVLENLSIQSHEIQS